MARRLNLAAALALLEQRYTQREIADIVGVHSRTIRKWKRGDTVPNAENMIGVSAAYRIEVRRVRATQARDKAKHPRAIPPDLLPPVRVERRELVRYWMDRATGRVEDRGERYESHWSNYDVRGWSFRALFDLFAAVHRAGATAVQFIMRVPPGTNVTTSDGLPVSRALGGGMKRTAKWTRTATPPINIEGAPDQAALADLLARFVPQVRVPGARAPEMLFLAVDDNSIRAKRAKGTKGRRGGATSRRRSGKRKRKAKRRR